MKNLKIIAELANSHNGNLSTILKTVNIFSKSKEKNFDLNFKFQVISANGLALKDYKWFKVYKNLEMDKFQWKKIINYTFPKGKIWLDIFDDYGLEILKKNINKIYGIKLQSSVLQNENILKNLNFLKRFKKKIIINFSGFEYKKINFLLKNFNTFKRNKNLILQYGFQSYPTNLNDLNISKLIKVKKKFPNYQLSFADHSSYKEPISKVIPIMLLENKIKYYEKHICISRKKAKYDFHSALEFQEFSEMLKILKGYNILNKERNSNQSERDYLSSSIQIPTLNKNILAKNQVTMDDIDFRRTSQKKTDIKNLTSFFSTTKFALNDLKKGKVISKNNFFKPKIAIIVAGRLKSSRLKNKALLKINGKPSIFHCLKSCTNSKDVNQVILATSFLKEDRPLKKFNLNNKVKVFTGHPEDVIKRYLDACKKYKVDIVVRVTADCPHISKEIINFLLKSHLSTKAEFTYATNAAAGTSAEIYNTNTLKKIKRLKKNTSLSEYMTWYVLNNKNFFKINSVKLPKEFSRNYRLTLDYNKDLILFNSLFKKLSKKKLKIDLKNIFLILDKYKNIRNINKNCKLVYKTDKKLINFLNLKTKF
tara:strand:+ start:7905 stop:9686 length:1782 start_codon:yes stop_codon:yes gene_type:complete